MSHPLHILNRVLCIFPALLFYWTQLLNQSTIYLLDQNNFWLRFLKLWCNSLIYSVRVFIVKLICLYCYWFFKKKLMSCVLFKGFNVSLNSSHNVNESVTGLKEILNKNLPFQINPVTKLFSKNATKEIKLNVYKKIID